MELKTLVRVSYFYCSNWKFGKVWIKGCNCVFAWLKPQHGITLNLFEVHWWLIYDQYSNWFGVPAKSGEWFGTLMIIRSTLGCTHCWKFVFIILWKWCHFECYSIVVLQLLSLTTDLWSRYSRRNFFFATGWCTRSCRPPVANELRHNRPVPPRRFDPVTILFSGIVGFR